MFGFATFRLLLLAYFGHLVTSQQRWRTPCKDVVTPPSVTRKLLEELQRSGQHASDDDTDEKVLVQALAETQRMRGILEFFLKVVRVLRSRVQLTERNSPSFMSNVLARRILRQRRTRSFPAEPQPTLGAE